MTMRLLPLTVLAFAALAAPAAASCAQSTPEQRVRRADAVFVGRVLSFDRERGSARFRVLRVRKGALTRGQRVRVVADAYPSSITIGWRPRRGQRWRLFVDRSGRRWTTNDCMGTRRL